MTKEDLAFIRALRDKGVEVTFSQPNKTVDSFYENPASMGSNASYPYRTLQNPSYGDIRINTPQHHNPNTIQELRLENRLRPTNITPEMMQGGSVESRSKEILEDLDYYGSGFGFDAFRKNLIETPGITVTLPDSTRYDDLQKVFDYVNESKVFAAGDTANYNANIDAYNRLIQNSLIQNQRDPYAGTLNPISTTPITDFESAEKLKKDIDIASRGVRAGFKTGKPRATRSISYIHTDYPFIKNPDGSIDHNLSTFDIAKAKLQGKDLKNSIPLYATDYTKFDYIKNPALYEIEVESPKETTTSKKITTSKKTAEVKKEKPSKTVKEEPKTMAVPRMEVEKRPATDIKGPWGTMSKEDFIKRYGQKVWDAQNRTPQLQKGAVESIPIDPETGKPFLDQDRPSGELIKERGKKAKNLVEARKQRKARERLEKARNNENVQWLLYNIYKYESDKDEQGNVNLGGFNLSDGESSAFGSGQFIGETRNSILEKYGVDAWSANPIEQELASIALIDSNGLLGKVKRGQFKGNSLTERVKVKDKTRPEGHRMEVFNWEAFVDDNASRLLDKPEDNSQWISELRKYRTNAVYKPSESFSKLDPNIQKEKADLFKRKYEGVWPTGEPITKPDSLIDFTAPGDSSSYTFPLVKITPELQEGLVEAKADNTAVNFVNPLLEQELYKKNQAIAAEELKRSKAENPGVIKEFVPPSAAEKALNIAANPVQAFGYSVRGEDMPMGLLPNSDNPIDMALDMINPAAWANYAKEAGKSAAQGDALGAGLNLLGAVPGIEIPGLTLGARTLVKPVVDKIQPVVKAGLDDMTDMLTTAPSAMKRDFGNLKFDIKNKIGPEKISADNVSNKALNKGYDRFDQTLEGRVSPFITVDNELFRTSARTFGQKYFDPSVIDLLEGLNRYDQVSKLAVMDHKLNLAGLGQMKRFNTRPLDLTAGGEYTNFLNTQKLSPNFTVSDELLTDFYTQGYDKFFNSPDKFINVHLIADFLERNPAVRNPSQKDLGLLMEGFDRFHKDVSGKLESLVLKTKLNKPTSLFRLEGGDFPVTVRRDGNIYDTKYSDMQVGDILLPDNRFKSTSYDKPAYWVGNMGSVINAPAGQSVLVPNLTGVRNYTNELEAILPSQLELQVKQISDRLPYFERGKLKNRMLDKSYAFDILNPYKKGGVEKMKQGGMERQKFSKEDLSFMRALRDRGVEVTFSGYKNDSPDKNNSANLIPSGNITMENVDKPVFAIDSKGNSTVMQPGQNYKFPGNAVLEIPMAKSGMVENGVPLLQEGTGNEGSFEGSGSFDNSLFGIDNSPSTPVAQTYNMTSASTTSPTDTTSMTGDAELTSGSPTGSDMGAGFNMSTLMAVGSGVSQISNSLAQLGPESSTEVGSVSGMGGSREQAVEGTIAGTMSSIPVVGQFYQIGAGIGSGFEAGANALYAEGNTAGGEAMTAMQGIFDPSSQFGRNAELWEAGYISDAEAVGGLLGGVIFGGAVGMDRRVNQIRDRLYKGAMTRATGGMHIAGTPSAESAGKFSRATGYPKPKRT